MRSRELITALELIPHQEGGYFAETYRSHQKLTTEREGQARNLCTSIFYMLTEDRPLGMFHCNQSDVIHYFHEGAPLRYTLVSPEGHVSVHWLGPDVTAGHTLQLIVPGGWWKATELVEGEYGLLGESVAPGFDYRDNELATRERFAELFPTLLEALGHLLGH